MSVYEWYGNVPKRMELPHGEVWSLGDQPTVSVLLQSAAGSRFHYEKVRLNEDMTYSSNPNGKEIKVYDAIDYRMTFGDLFAKMELCYGKES